uniref:YfhO family protein n=1 Tax=Eiseniibacteriota bacterium TaxID=2212470 RepID=A0A832MKU2_UNCEI
MNERRAPSREARRPAATERAAPPARAPGAAWAFAILALLTVLFFHELSLGGQTFVSPDTTAPAGFVQVGEVSLWRDRVYPLWNPFIFLGMPSFGSGAYNPLIYPPDWPLALIARVVPLPDMTWMLIYYALAGFFAFLLARELGARPEGALLGAVAFTFAPNLVAVGSHGHGSQLVNSAYLPLMVWIAARWLRRGGLEHLGWLALAGGFQMLRGHVQIAYYTWIAIAALALALVAGALARRRDLAALAGRAAALAVAAGLAFGLAGFFNLPLRDYARWSIRGGGEGGGVGMDYATQWSLSPAELPTLVVPGWAGFGGALYWGGMPFTDYPNVYLGAVAVLLALPAFLPGAPGGAAPRAFALALAVFALLVSFGRHGPLYGVLYDHLPLFNKFRVPVMAVVLLQLAAMLGLAWGWSAVLAAPRPAKGAPADPLDRALLVAGGVSALAFLSAALGGEAWAEGYGRLVRAHRPDFPDEAVRLAYQGFLADLGRAGLLGLGATALAWFARRGLPAGVASLAVLALLLVELVPVSRRVMEPTIGPVVRRSVEAGRDDIVDFLERAGAPGEFRVLSLAEFQSNRFAGFSISTVGGYHAAKPKPVQNFMDRGLQGDPLWLRLLNVRYIVAPQPLEPAPEFLREVHRGSQVVYENLLALPRATVVGEWRLAANDTAVFDSIRAAGRDPAEVTWLLEDPGVPSVPVAGASARVTAYRLNDVTVEVDTPAPALLRLADAWYPDWTAAVDGRPAKVLRADHLLRAVAVPAGRHTVTFRFASRAVRDGLVLSLASLAVVLALIVTGTWRARSRAAAPAPAAAPGTGAA